MPLAVAPTGPVSGLAPVLAGAARPEGLVALFAGPAAWADAGWGGASTGLVAAKSDYDEDEDDDFIEDDDDAEDDEYEEEEYDEFEDEEDDEDEFEGDDDDEL